MVRLIRGSPFLKSPGFTLRLPETELEAETFPDSAAADVAAFSLCTFRWVMEQNLRLKIGVGQS